NKYDALKTRFLDQVELLHRMTLVDLKVFFAYMTLQLGIGAWVAANKQAIDTPFLKIGLMVIDLGIAIVATGLLYNNRRRRTEVIATVRNCNQALGYEDEGAFLPSHKLNAETTTRFWATWYYIALAIAFIGVAIITFSSVSVPSVG
ncbi:hypothetical protein ACFL4Y_04410, partial [Gemmatimonadota bacterium]